MTGGRSRRRPLLLVAVMALALVAACGSDGNKTTASSGSPSSGSSSGSSGSSSSGAQATTTLSVYFLRDEKVAPVRRTVPQTTTVAKAAMDALLAGPTDDDGAAHVATAIPAGTTLHGVTIDAGLATVDLSASFASGGGSSSMQGRVAQVVYTLTQFPTVTGVNFELDGQPVTALGGEGLVLDHPQTRADWEDVTPAILVESPLPGDVVTSPLHVTGTANTFEATFQIQLQDAGGAKVYDHFATATSGSGTRGTYDETITFTTAAHGTGTLTVFEVSAKDGSRINEVDIPVQV